MGVSKNRGTPKSSILIGFSIINHPFWGIPIFGNTHIDTSTISRNIHQLPQASNLSEYKTLSWYFRHKSSQKNSNNKTSKDPKNKCCLQLFGFPFCTTFFPGRFPQVFFGWKKTNNKKILPPPVGPKAQPSLGSSTHLKNMRKSKWIISNL